MVLEAHANRRNGTPARVPWVEDEDVVTSENQRILSKLDDIQSTTATMGKDVARMQGEQTGLRVAIEAVSHAIGDVTQTKIQAATMAVALDDISRRLGALETAKTTEGRDQRWQAFLQHLATGLASGGAVAALARWPFGG